MFPISHDLGKKLYILWLFENSVYVPQSVKVKYIALISTFSKLSA